MRPWADDRSCIGGYGCLVTTSHLRRGAPNPGIDLLIAAGVLAVELVGTWLWSRASAVDGPDLIGYTLLVLVAGFVAVRNTYPVPALAVIASAATTYMWLGEPAPFWTVALVLATWAAVSAGHRLATILICGAFMAAFLVGGFILRIGHAADTDAPLWLVGWLTAAFVLGEVSRGRREYIAQVEQRAIDAERTREEEARRRAGEERMRIARELHDVLAHSISVINVQAGVAVHLLDRQPEQARAALLTINDASKEAMRELRATLGLLRQSDDIDPRAPAPGLARLDELVDTARSAGLDVTVATTGEQGGLPPAADLAAYRIVQESLTNVNRHAGATHVAVSIIHRQEEVELTIEDDGGGLAAGAELRPGNGLVGMRERAVAIGGELDAGPLPGGGFRVHARLPAA
jgi:signal transduction histidine kinase